MSLYELLKGKEPFSLSTHGDADGLFSAEMLRRIFKVKEPIQIPAFGVYNTDVALDLGSPLSQDWAGICLSGDTEIFFKDIYNRVSSQRLLNLYSDKIKVNGLTPLGTFESSEIVKSKTNELFHLTLKNGVVIKCTGDHKFLCLNGLKQAKDMTEEKDYLPFNLIKIKGDGGSYSVGYFIGLYLAEGHLYRTNAVSISNKDRGIFNKIIELYDYLGCNWRINLDKTTGVYALHSKSRILSSLIKTYTSGSVSIDKSLKSKVYSMNEEFRTGLLCGIYDGDGNKDRQCISTISKGLAYKLTYLLASLAMPYSIRYYDYAEEGDNRHGFYRISFGKRNRCFKWFNKNPYCLITSIEKETFKTGVYCLNLDSEYFVLSSGFISHNCIDHHEKDDPKLRKYTLYWDSVPTGKILYDNLKGHIDPKDRWLLVGSLGGDSQVELTPDEIWDAFPVLLQGRGILYQSQYKLGVSDNPLYVFLSSGVNALCRLGFPEQALEVLKICKSPVDLLENDGVRDAVRSMKAEEEAVYKSKPIVESYGNLVLVRIRTSKPGIRLCGLIASKLRGANYDKTYLVINELTGEGSIRGTLAKYYANKLTALGFKAGGHAMACGLSVPEENIEGFYTSLRMIAA